MFWKTLAVVYGVFAAVFPEKKLEYLTRMVLVGYENPEDLEPSDWYVSAVRTEGVLVALAGVGSIVLSLAVASSDTKDAAATGDETDE